MIKRSQNVGPTLFYRWRTKFKEAGRVGERLETACEWLQLNPRAVYRWKSGATSKPRHGGGGGRNRITQFEEKRVLTLARRFPQLRCRRIAYELGKRSRKPFCLSGSSG